MWRQGEDYVDQLQLVTGLLGSPSEEEMAFVTSDLARKFMRKLPKADKVPLASLFRDSSSTVRTP